MIVTFLVTNINRCSTFNEFLEEVKKVVSSSIVQWSVTVGDKTERERKRERERKEL